jgi:hypothetical protein
MSVSPSLFFPFFFYALVTEVIYEEDAEYAIQLLFDGYAFFQGDESPPFEDVAATLANADYNRYLEDFVWERLDDLDGVFLGVVLVEYDRQA